MSKIDDQYGRCRKIYRQAQQLQTRKWMAVRQAYTVVMV